MNRRVAWAVAVVAAVVVLLLVVPLFRTDSSGGPSALEGQAAPVIAMKDDVGQPASLSSYRGKIVVLNLWASWCPPCRAEMPDLQHLSDLYARDGVVVIGVNQGESAERAGAFAHSLGIRFPVWIDDSQAYGRIFAALGLPTTIVVGRDGIVVHGFDGALTFEQMKSTIAPLVSTK